MYLPELHKYSPYRLILRPFGPNLNLTFFYNEADNQKKQLKNRLKNRLKRVKQNDKPVYSKYWSIDSMHDYSQYIPIKSHK